MTQYRLRSVGSGMGPDTLAPVFWAVSTMSLRGLINDLVIVALEADADLLACHLRYLRNELSRSGRFTSVPPALADDLVTDTDLGTGS